MDSLPRKKNLRFSAFYAGICLAGLATFLVSAPLLPLEDWQGLLLFAALCGLAQSMPIPLFRSSSVSVSAALTLAGMVVYGPAAAVWINLGSSIVAAFRPKVKPLQKSIFNLCNHALGAGIAGTAYWVAGGPIGRHDALSTIFPALLAAMFYFMVQTSLISAIIALQEGVSFKDTWDTNFRWSALNFAAMGVISLGMANAEVSMGLPGIVIFSIPLAMIWYSIQLFMGKSQAVRMQNEALRMANERLQGSYVSTIRVLAAAIDAKDHYTRGHSEATMRYAVAIAREMGLDEEEVAGVHISALLHDIGKIGVPDSVLNKPSKLSQEEWQTMVKHPTLGADLVVQVDLLSSAVESVKHHHEHYDGSGYPSGLKGDQIHPWAQIIAVADSLQAMTSDRPYRRALTIEAGLAELRRCSGTQFSPQVVDAIHRVVANGGLVREITIPALPRYFQLSLDDTISKGD